MQAVEMDGQLDWYREMTQNCKSLHVVVDGSQLDDSKGKKKWIQINELYSC